MKKYESLFQRYHNQPRKECFAFFPFDRKAGETWETPFAALVNLAKPEEWNFIREEFRRQNVRYPILYNYLNYTFKRLQDQNKIVFNEKEDGACFNTGLMTPDEKELFALFSKNHRADGSADVNDWFFKGFFDSYADQLAQFRNPLPALATYVEDASELVLDTSFELDVNIGHILDDPDNQERLPVELRNNRNLALSAIEGATRFLKQKVIRNYKVAIPQWYMPDQKIQLLLPLCIMSPEKADLALVADKDKDAKLYRIRTALRMDMAYSNARLITRPDREWLDP